MTPHDELRRRLEHPRRAAVRGVYNDSGAAWAGMPWRFTYRPPGAWRIQYAEGVGDELITDGSHAWVVEDGVAIVVAREGKALVGNKLWNLVADPGRIAGVRSEGLLPPRAPIPPQPVDVHEDELGGRAVWVVRLLNGWALAIDQVSGVGLRWWSDAREITIDDLEIDPPLPPDWFGWSGPQDPGRRPGLVYVGVPSDEKPDSFSSHWEVYLASGFVYCEYGPGDVPVDFAVAWARQRAREVEVRTADLTSYSAGEAPPRGEPLPEWQG